MHRKWVWLAMLCVVAVLAQSSLHLIRPVTSYKILDLGGSATTIGTATAAYALLPVLVASSMGRRSDRTARLWRWMVLGLTVMVLGSVQLIIAADTAWILAGSATLGVGHVVLTICLQAVIARRALRGSLAAGFGWFTAANSLGQMAGPYLGGWLIDSGSAQEGGARAGIDLALVIGTVFAVLAVPVAMMGRRHFTVPESAETAGPAHEHRRESTWSLIRRPRVGLILYCSLGFVALVDILTAFMPLIGEESGIAPTAIGALLAIRGGASLASRVALPWLTARLSSGTLLTGSLIGSAVCFSAMPLLIDTMWLAVLLTAVGGFVLGIGQPVTMEMISTAVPSGARGQALALRLVSSRLGQVLVPLGAGGLAGALGPIAAVQLASAVLVSASAVSAVRGRGGPP